MFYFSDHILRSTFLDGISGIFHGFSTRHGGVSTLPHTATMNLTRNLGDSDDAVSENLDRFARSISENRHGRSCTVTAHQIHSAKVRLLDESNAGEESSWYKKVHKHQVTFES